MPKSYVLLPGDGATTNFSFNFGYLSSSHISVAVDTVDTPFTFVDSFTVQVSPAPANGTVIEIRRRTPTDEPIVDWVDGTVLAEEDLDLNTLFSLYTAQEAEDNVADVLRLNAVGVWDGQGRQTQNFGEPVDGAGLVTKDYFDTVYIPQLDQIILDANTDFDNKVAAANSVIDGKVTVATNKADEASTSATSAQSSASAAATSESNALDYLNTFRGQYLGAFTSPPTVDGNGDPLSDGDLYADTTMNRMRVYFVGEGWKDAGSTIDATLKVPTGNVPVVATGGETSIAIPGGYDAPFIQVTVNGVEVVGSDVDVSSGTDIVFASPLSPGDEVFWRAFGAFQVSNAVPTAGDATTGAALIPAGTEAQRPGTPTNGMFRYNEETNQFEGAFNGQWLPLLNSNSATERIGVPFPVLDHLAGVSPPDNSGIAKYIKLTAADPYNTGLLTSESVTGSAPLVVATAVISLADSPLNGLTVNLWNTERRIPRAGAAGTLENDAIQYHGHNLTGPGQNYVNFSYGGSLGGYGVAPAADNQGLARLVAGSGVDTYNLYGRFSNETRVKNQGVTYYMRIK